MRFMLAVALVLLFLWLHKAHMSTDTFRGSACSAVSRGEAAASLLLSPLSLYTWFTSTLLRLLLSVPALVLSCLHHSLLLLLAWPWCVANVCVSLLLTCLRVALYLLHMALVLGVVVILTLTQPKLADNDPNTEKVLCQQKMGEMRRTTATPRMFGCRALL